MRATRLALCSLALAGLVALPACGSDDDGVGATTTAAAAASTPSTTGPGGTAAADALTLEGVTWTLSDETDLGVDLAGVDVTAQFLEGTVAGLSGCNRYSGRYTLDGDKLSISPQTAGTMMACSAPQMTVEGAYLAALPTVATYVISGDILTLSDQAGKAVLVYRHIAGSEAIAGDWTVTAVRSADAVSSPVPGSTITVTFADGTVSGNAGCNQFNGAYEVDGDNLTIGPLATTRMACADPAVGKQETDFLAALQNTATFSATGEMLTLLADDGTITAVMART